MKYFSLFLTFFITCFCQAQKDTWRFELHSGIPCNIPLPLTIIQDNQPDLRLNAKYISKPFSSPFYWVWRVSRWENNKSWEVEAVHHKLYLVNTPEEVQYFTISHGYNIITINRAYRKSLFQKFPILVRLGAGFILAHPESRIRHQEFEQRKGAFGMGYYISGSALNFTLAKQFELSRRLFINTEAKFHPSFARVPISNGHADVWNIAFELALGMGFNITKEEKE